LSNLINEGALLAARGDKREIDMSDLDQAIDKVNMGPEKKTRIISPKEKENTAYHEVGHALMFTLLPHANPLHKVTIIPRGFALGVTMSYPDEDVLSHSRTQLIDQIGALLGGRVAEEIVFGEVTTGAMNDLERSTGLARRMITEWGMSQRLGPMTFGRRNDQPFMGRDFGHERDYGENIATVIDEEVSDMISTQYTRVKEILVKHRPHMDAIVKILLEKETLDKAEVDAIVEEINRKIANGENPVMDDKTDITPPQIPPSATGDESGVVITAPGDEPDVREDPKPDFKPKYA
jgi:cell division protease FtsH